MLLEKLKEIVECNEKRKKQKTPKGTCDFSENDTKTRNFPNYRGRFQEAWCATALDTPVFERKETLMGKYGEESKLIYDLANRDRELCSLRYDLTIPFARFMAQNGKTSFKRYQIGKVYRRENTSKGRRCEFFQCDFDIAGQYTKMLPDFEVIQVMTELLDELDIGEYEIKLNHRKLLDAMLDVYGVPPENFRTICSEYRQAG